MEKKLVKLHVEPCFLHCWIVGIVTQKIVSSKVLREEQGLEDS